MIGLFGGAFDPPHNGHVALLARAKNEFGLQRAVVVVTAAPAHKSVQLPPEVRLELTQLSFPGEAVVLDAHGRTIDMLRAHPEWEGAIFLVGADEFADLLRWKEPNELLRLVRLGVAARPGYPRARLQDVLARLEQPERVLFFELKPLPIASRDVRERLNRGEDVHDLIPPAVWGVIERDGLYGRGRRYTQSA